MDGLFDAILWDRDGGAIEEESFRRIDREVAPTVRARFTDAEWHVARRLVHTCADFTILDQLEFSGDPITAALTALRGGARIYADSNMIKSGLSVGKLKRFFAGYERDSILCPIADAATADYAQKRGITRALAAVELHAAELNGAVFLCGNAPLALAGVVQLAVERGIAPALIIAMPVGFVNVVEAKKLLDAVKIPYVRLSGRRGGSPLAVAALHGMMECG